MSGGLDSVEELLEVLRGPHSGLGRLRRGALADAELQAFLWERLGAGSALQRKVEGLFERLAGNPSLLLFALRYTLEPAGAPTAALELAPGLSLAGLGTLRELLAAHPEREEELVRGLRERIERGELAEWLRAREVEGWEAMLALMEATRRRYLGARELPGYAVLWRYAPELPLPFGEGAVHDPRELAGRIDASEAGWRRGIELLDSGWLRTWLEATGRVRDAGALDRVLGGSGSSGLKLEALLRSLDPTLAAPELVAKPATLDLGVVSGPEAQRVALELERRGRGHAWGRIELAGAREGLLVEPAEFDGTPVQVRLTVTPAALAAGAGRREAQVVVHLGSAPDAAPLRVPVRYRLGAPFGATLLRLMGGLPAAEERASSWHGSSREELATRRHAAERTRSVLGGVSGAFLGAVLGGVISLVASFVVFLALAFVPGLILWMMGRSHWVEAAWVFVGGALSNLGALFGGVRGASVGASASRDSVPVAVVLVALASALAIFLVANAKPVLQLLGGATLWLRGGS